MKKRRQPVRSKTKHRSKQHFAMLLQYPSEWLAWGMYPDKLFEIQVHDYKPGSETASEHYRYGAFRWWMSKPLSDKQLAKCVVLTFLDPDQIMAADARKHLSHLFKCRTVRLRSIATLESSSVPSARTADVIERFGG